jgi:PKD repeat protein
MRHKGGFAFFPTNKGKAVVSFSLAAIMLTSIFAAMAPMGCAIWGDVTFDVPSTVSIEDTFTLAGTANRGECVDIAVDNYVYPLLNDLVIGEHGQFSKNINTATAGIVGFQIPGSVRLKGYIDRAAGAGAVGSEETEDGSTVILMVRGDLVVWLSRDTVALDDDFTINGNAAPNSSLNLLIISPKGSGGTLIYGNGKGIYNTTVTVATNGTFSKRINVGFNVDVGSYAIVVLSPGADGVYNGLPPGTSVDNFMEELEKKYILASKTQEQLIAIIQDATIAAAGSDDLLYLVYIKVEVPYVELDPIENVMVGEPLVVTGTSNRRDGFAIVITVKGPKELKPQTVLLKDGKFSATFDTTDAPVGPYVVKVDDGDGHTDTTIVEIFAPMNYPPTAIIDSIMPNSAKQGTDAVSFIGHGNDSDGSVVAYNWSSSIDGLLNTSSSFTKPASELSVGTHTISFTVQDDDGAWSSADTGILTIEAANQPPVASFSYSPVNPGINEPVTFNASFSLDQDGNITSYNWSFGDGNISNTSEVVITHSYSSVGNYTVNLTVTDDEGATNTTSRELQVCLKPPIATFACSPPNPVVNETVTFNASESYDPNGVITTYQFEFGDGTNGTGEVVTHTYSSVGTYTVNLTLTDNEGATNRTSQLIKVFSNISYFDTEAGTYPSISGTLNGTITMTHTVNVSKIYIYPCTGTGGHAEYAKIWNTSWDGAEAHWNGYVDDWHNLPFDKNFTLVAGETYNYTIQTGSYPQIHHTAELLTAKGWITCTSFIDTNGKRHDGWIPAIRLE